MNIEVIIGWFQPEAHRTGEDLFVLSRLLSVA